MNFISWTLLAFFVTINIFTLVNCERKDNQTIIGCRDKLMDIFFVLDKSWDDLWDDNLTTQFLANVVSGLDVSANKTRVGVVTVKRTTKTQSLYFNRSTNRLVARESGRDEDLKDNENFHDVLAYLRESQEFRQNVSKLIVIITNGGLRYPNTTVTQAKTAQKEGFYIFVLAIGQYWNDWVDVASDPDKEFHYVINDFPSLDSVRMTLLNRTCLLAQSLVVEKQETTFTCSNVVYSTLYYVSGSDDTLNLTYQISDYFLDHLTGYSKDNHVGYFFPNCRKYNKPLQKAENLCPRNKPMNRMSLGELINEVDKKAAESVIDRGDHIQVVLMVVDDGCIGEVGQDTIKTLIEEKYMEIILVHVNSTGVDNRVRDDVGPSNYIRFIPGTTQLKQVLRTLDELTCEALKRIEDRIGPGPS